MVPKVKQLSVRSIPVKKWSSEGTEFLLELLKQSGINHDEKPTAQIYYSENNIILEGYSWQSVRDKVKHLKTKHKAAKDWRANTGAGLDETDDATTIREKFMQMCPLDIYSEKRNRIVEHNRISKCPEKIEEPKSIEQLHTYKIWNKYMKMRIGA